MMHSTQHNKYRLKRLAFALAAVVAAGLGGCAGGPFKDLSTSASQGTVYILRAPGGMPGDYPKPVFIDGKVLGPLVRNSYFMVRLAPGEHRISTPAANKPELELHVVKGADYYISQEIIPANPPFILLNRVGEKFGKSYVEHSRRLY